jgi:hypothetical protein
VSVLLNDSHQDKRPNRGWIEVIGLATSVASRRASSDKCEAEAMWRIIAEDAQALVGTRSRVIQEMLLYKSSIWAAT